jgi:hypothetical protein
MGRRGIEVRLSRSRHSAYGTIHVTLYACRRRHHVRHMRQLRHC